jgi:hypothetical protein
MPVALPTTASVARWVAEFRCSGVWRRLISGRHDPEKVRTSWMRSCVRTHNSRRSPGQAMSSADTVPRQQDDVVWREALGAIRAGRRDGASKWDRIFGPLGAGRVDDLVVVGQIGQSLDGRAATSTGHSHYINGSDGLDHLHRLRAIVDAVVVGVGTALADDPLLTVRRVAGRRPRGRCARTARGASSSRPLRHAVNRRRGPSASCCRRRGGTSSRRPFSNALPNAVFGAF